MESSGEIFTDRSRADNLPNTGKKKVKSIKTRREQKGKKKSRGKDDIRKGESKHKYPSEQFSIRSRTVFYMDNRGMTSEDWDSEPDRSDPQWKIVSEEEESFVEEEEISEEESVKQPLSIWDEIMTEYEDKMYEFYTLNELQTPFEPALPILSKLSAVQYLNEYIFPLLCPALEETLFKATESECLMIQKCSFNGLDYISELLWNRNPLHPERLENYRTIFNIPFVIVWLYYNPRPIFPLSWLWTKEEAVTVLQSYIRRYLIYKEAECSEMRQFWKVLKEEKEEEKENLLTQSIEELEALFSEVFDRLVSEAVYQVEWKKNACGCIKKPCYCSCKCMKWCKCCKCYKEPPKQDNVSYSTSIMPKKHRKTEECGGYGYEPSRGQSTYTTF